MKREEMTSQEYWHRVLIAGGFTPIPRWTLNPVAGIAQFEIKIEDDLVTALQQLAAELEVSLSSVFLTGHSKVLSALSGEQRMATGYVAMAGGLPLPCQLTTSADTWRALLLNTHQIENELLSHKEYPVTELQGELDLTESLFEVVFDPNGNGRILSEDIVLWTNILQKNGQLALQLHYLTEVLDKNYAARIAGYYLSALTLIAHDPDAKHTQQSLLSDDELHFQIEGLSGPKRKLPDKRFHELFEQRVQAHPHRIAAENGDRRWTYQELNGRANKLGRALLAQGLENEGVVAVVTERNLDWMASVLAIFKAGGVYLPIEPLFPADRITSMLSQSQCRLILTESGSTQTLMEALDSMPDVQTLFIEEAYKENHDEENLSIEVEPNQLAYIYFTSGSTGKPKGAMCEHAGMLNHLFAKIEDFEIGNRPVVAQIAPQCFDISLWQLVSGLLVGGRTLLVKQEIILDVQQFIETIVNGRVSVMQVVPSYLEVVLTYLDQHPTDLPELNCVSVTGEALTKELTSRWFAAKPGIKLANAYGLTETSDDTNHEVMDQPPDRERVPLGSAVNNVYIYVVDEYLAPVPLGAPGEIVFSGVCVGRGYINDPVRTKLAYMDDPIRKGKRLYRSGDYGRWQPDGKLEFLGRRDAQIKIRGFRIEIGDIENTLLHVPGVRQGAVVVIEREDRSKHLVAFYTSHRPFEVDDVQDRLSQSLPAYMVPSIFHWRDNLPLTANSKIDRKALRALAKELDTIEEAYQPPVTQTEQRLAVAWAQVLGIPENQLGRHDHFFDRGGTSLSAVRLAIKLERAVSLKDVTRYPILTELAELVDGRTKRQADLLQSLSKPVKPQIGALVCFPYAGGNAVNFQPLATILGSNGLAVFAVELPGHDLSNESEEFTPLAQIVDRVVAEIINLGLDYIMLWGHSSGAAIAVETAVKLQEKGVDVQQIFIGAQLLGDANERRAANILLSEQSNAEIAAYLSRDRGYTELGELDDMHAEHIGAAFRHDYDSANRYFANAIDKPPIEKLSSPITVVIAEDDPLTAEFPAQYHSWQLLSENVNLHKLKHGGHYFLRTRPAEAAQVVLSYARLLTS